MNPKVFVCHASEDKNRFVLQFARRLREEKGIDAWVDKWEMKLGDSLRQKIFEEGLKNAQAIIVVLSAFSVDKPWVNEELDIAMVRKINGESRLIPVIIDNCIIPECLKATVHQRIKEVTSYEDEFREIVSSILDQSSKPSLGALPKFATTVVDRIYGLTDVDSLILNLACEAQFEKQGLVGFPLWEMAEKYGISASDFHESLDILERKGYICGERLFRGGIFLRAVSMTSFDRFLAKRIPQYDYLVRQVCLEILNNQVRDSLPLSKSTGQPMVVINHILDRIAARGLFNLYNLGSARKIDNISPELKRILQNEQERL
jgi:hypothetical protein